jgi:hypothetical protein
VVEIGRDGMGLRERYHPASRERAAERMQGVSVHGLWVGAVFEPIVAVVDLVARCRMVGIEFG